MSRKEKTLVIGGSVVAGIIVAWLLAQSGTDTTQTGAVPYTGMQGGNDALPNAEYNINFQGPTVNNPALRAGYVPLFGFIGWSRQWS